MLFVFNPKAGKGKIKTNLLDIVDIFNKGGYEVIIYSTQKPKDAYEKAKEYESKVDLIVCSGGDGTLDEVVTGVMEKKSSIPIGYIPAVRKLSNIMRKQTTAPEIFMKMTNASKNVLTSS